MIDLYFLIGIIDNYKTHMENLVLAAMSRHAQLMSPSSDIAENTRQSSCGHDQGYSSMFVGELFQLDDWQGRLGQG